MDHQEHTSAPTPSPGQISAASPAPAQSPPPAGGPPPKCNRRLALAAFIAAVAVGSTIVFSFIPWSESADDLGLVAQTLVALFGFAALVVSKIVLLSSFAIWLRPMIRTDSRTFPMIFAVSYLITAAGIAHLTTLVVENPRNLFQVSAGTTLAQTAIWYIRIDLMFLAEFWIRTAEDALSGRLFAFCMFAPLAAYPARERGGRDRIWTAVLEGLGRRLRGRPGHGRPAVPTPVVRL